MDSSNPRKRQRTEVPTTNTKPPATHIASYKSLRNLKTKLVKAKLHITNLQKALEDKKPPFRLLPKIQPFIPTSDPILIVKWEASGRDYALNLVKLLLTYWQERVPILENERDNLTKHIKEAATKEDFDQIIEISDRVAEKHRLAPPKPPRKPLNNKGKNPPSTSKSTTTTWKDPNIQPRQTEGSPTNEPETPKDNNTTQG
jgi:hypothetical protein